MKTLLKCLKQYVVAVFIAVLAMGTYAQHYGLFVGINEYSLEYGASSLSGCVKDVTNFSTMCITHGEWISENIVKLTDSGATKSAVRGAITELAAKAVAGDTVLLFQSSHGGQIADKDVYLCTHDDDYYDYELAEDLSKFKSGVKLVVVVDACHSGGLFKSVSKPNWNLASSVASHMKSAIAKKVAKGIKSDTISDSEIGWITAADYDEYSWDGSGGALFTTEMLEGWANGDADFDASGDVTFLELFDYAKLIAVDEGTVAQCLNDNVLESVVAGDVGGFAFLIDEENVLIGFTGTCPANVVIPDSVVAIAESAFDADYNDVENLESVTISASVTSIGNYAFWKCYNLSEVIFKGEMSSVDFGYGVFAGTLYAENSPFTLLINKDNVLAGFIGPCPANLVIPDGVVEIAESAFDADYNDVGNLESVTIPASLTSIGDYAFYKCANLTDVFWKGDVFSIEFGDYVFYGTQYEIIIPEQFELLIDEDNVLIGFIGPCPANVVIPDGVVEIAESAFNADYNDVENLESVTIPASVTSIGDYAFYGCENLTNVVWEGDVFSIEFGASVFYGTQYEIPEQFELLIDEDNVLLGFIGPCPANVVISDGVVAIAESAFDADYNDVENLESVTIPASVTNIGNYAFWGCSNLKNVEGGVNLERVGYGVFSGTLFLYGADSWDEVYENEDYDNGNGLDLVYLGSFIVDVRGWLNEAENDKYYDEDGNWIWEYDLVIPEGTTGMANELLYGLPITSVTIPGSVKRIPEYAFESCSIRKVVIKEGVEELDEHALCDNDFGSIDLPSSLKKVACDALAGSDTLSNVVFRSSETVFDAAAFRTYIDILDENFDWIGVVDRCSTNLCPPKLDKVGYSLVGWRTVAIDEEQKSLEAKFDADDLTPFASTNYNNMLVYPIVEANKYLIAFDSNGGSLVDSIEVAFDSKYGELPLPKRAGYTFAGWYNGETLVTSETVAGVGNQSLVAKWTANTYTIKYDSNGGEGSMLNQALTYDVASSLNPCTFDKSGYEFIGWALSPTSDSIAYQDKASVKNLISTNGAVLTLYALWERTALWAPPSNGGGSSNGDASGDGNSGASGEVFTGELAEVYDGYISDEDEVIGTIQAKTAKAKNGISKVTVTIQIVGEKKLTLKGEMSVEDAEFEAVAKDGRVLVLQFGLNGIFGDFDGYLIDGAKNFFSSKDKTEKADAEGTLESYLGVYNIVTDRGILSAVIAKKGKVTIKGAIDGNKVSVKAQALIGADMICIPVVYSKKSVNLAFTIWLPLNGGEAEVIGLDNPTIGKLGKLKEGAKFIIDGDIGASIETEDERTLDLLPNGETITESDSKWLVAGGAKAAKVSYKGDLIVTPGKKGGEIANTSGLKLSYKAKDGSFKGSFTVYAIVKGKLKKHKATVEGVLVNGIGYGSITIKKIGTWTMIIK